MPAIATECNNEDGILEVQVQYYTDRSIKVLEGLAEHMRPRIRPACHICGCDADYRTDTGKTLCTDHVQKTWDWSYAVAL